MNIRKTRTVFNLDTETEYIFTDKTPIEALQAMIYTLSLKNASAKNSIINKTKSGKTLFFEYKNETFSVLNN